MLRFSSLGDVTQALSVPTRLKELAPEGEIHWVTKSIFSELIENHPHVEKVWSVQKKMGLTGFFILIKNLRAEKFTHIYDAHNSLRSKIICSFLRFPWDFSRAFSQPEFLRKSQKRFYRFLLFRFRINYFRQPFSGQRDLLEPLSEWGLIEELPPAPQLVIPNSANEKVDQFILQNDFATKKFICLAPSAAHFLKRWPVDYWKKLIKLNPDKYFVLLGGPEDLFLSEISTEFPGQVLNSAGQFSLIESASVISKSLGLVSNDTGVLHIAEQLGKKTIALMGPAPFGFPSRKTTQILELKLACRPCSKHGQAPCKNKSHHECLRGILPELVSFQLQKMLLD
jgi:ADP-heptose:LPS heptosyltransferase